MSITSIVAIPQNDDITVNCDGYAKGEIWRTLCHWFTTDGQSVIITSDDSKMLGAMHAATGRDESPYAHLCELLHGHSELRLTRT
jgi:hypothetical protein